ncbi:MAG: malto-oligosyltrehalose synthase, partial [Atribacterota bacterium]
YKQYHLKSGLYPFISYEKLTKSLQEIMIRMPIYRTYISPSRLNKEDKNLLTEIITQTIKSNPELTNELNYLSSEIIFPLFAKKIPANAKNTLIKLLMRWQQYTGPLMAKGMEDTLLYSYYPLVSLNEVGGEPAIFGINKNEFYRFMQKRIKKWPYSISASTTHDTKRGEDIRARINVLSEIPKQWQEKLYHWHHLNIAKKKKAGALLFPDKNMEYFIYQTLIGTFPFSGLSGVNRVYQERIQQYLLKSAREAKTYTSWLNPYKPYEEALIDFTNELLKQGDQKNNQFLNDLFAFQKTISHYGMLNSLSQILLKLTCPGVPDFYQGSELWDFRLVDPDNRRPVDYKCRIHYLEDIQIKKRDTIVVLLEELLAKPADGRIKLFIIHQLLQLRKKEPELFHEGSFIPLAVQGKHKNHLLTYLREYQDKAILVVIPRFYTSLVKPGQYPLGKDIWEDTIIKLPISIKEQAWDCISEKSIQLNNLIPIGKILEYFPVSVILIRKGVS